MEERIVQATQKEGLPIRRGGIVSKWVLRFASNEKFFIMIFIWVVYIDPYLCSEKALFEQQHFCLDQANQVAITFKFSRLLTVEKNDSFSEN